MGVGSRIPACWVIIMAWNQNNLRKITAQHIGNVLAVISGGQLTLITQTKEPPTDLRLSVRNVTRKAVCELVTRHCTVSEEESRPPGNVRKTQPLRARKSGRDRGAQVQRSGRASFLITLSRSGQSTSPAFAKAVESGKDLLAITKIMVSRLMSGGSVISATLRSIGSSLWVWVAEFERAEVNR